MNEAMKEISGDERDYWMRTVSRLRMRNSDLLDLLERAAEVLNNYADVRDGDGGRPQPNAAMSMESEITEFLREVRQ